MTLAGLEYAGMRESVNAFSRIIHTVIQGALVGAGFLGGGIILRDAASKEMLYHPVLCPAVKGQVLSLLALLVRKYVY